MRYIFLSIILVFISCSKICAQTKIKRIDAFFVDPNAKTDATPLSFIEFSETGIVTSSNLPDKDLEMLLRHNAIPAKVAQYLLIPDFLAYALLATTNINITPDDLEKWLFNACKLIQGCEFNSEQNRDVFFEYTLAYEKLEEEIYDKFVDPINKKAIRIKEDYTIHSDGDEIVGFIKVVHRNWSESLPIQMAFHRIDQTIHIQHSASKMPFKKYILEEKSGLISSLRLENIHPNTDSGAFKSLVFEYSTNDQNSERLTKVNALDSEGNTDHFITFKYSFWEN